MRALWWLVAEVVAAIAAKFGGAQECAVEVRQKRVGAAKQELTYGTPPVRLALLLSIKQPIMVRMLQTMPHFNKVPAFILLEVGQAAACCYACPRAEQVGVVE